MLGHTKKHPIKKLNSDSVDQPFKQINEVLQELCGDLPHWAIMLKGLRHREGLTQKQISETLEIAQGNISQMENGKRPIGKKLAKRLADLFHTDYRLFL